MSAKHTPGRLVAEELDQDDDFASVIRQVDGDPYPFHVAYCSCPADARRLVACWNACEGVPTEVLEAQQSGGLPWSVADQIEQRVQFDAYKEGSEEAFGAVVEQKRKAEECVSRMESTIQSQQGVIVKMRTQRDELLAALKEVADTFGEDWMEGSTQRRFGDLARAAIAKAEGGAS